MCRLFIHTPERCEIPVWDSRVSRGSSRVGPRTAETPGSRILLWQSNTGGKWVEGETGAPNQSHMFPKMEAVQASWAHWASGSGAPRPHTVPSSSAWPRPGPGSRTDARDRSGTGPNRLHRSSSGDPQLEPLHRPAGVCRMNGAGSGSCGPGRRTDRASDRPTASLTSGRSRTSRAP